MSASYVPLHCEQQQFLPSALQDWLGILQLTQDFQDVAFRVLHLAEFTELFVQVVRLAREMGLVKLGTIAVDGLKGFQT